MQGLRMMGPGRQQPQYHGPRMPSPMIPGGPVPMLRPSMDAPSGSLSELQQLANMQMMTLDGAVGHLHAYRCIFVMCIVKSNLFSLLFFINFIIFLNLYFIFVNVYLCI